MKKNYLGIDWGKSKIGISFSDNETKMAFAYETLKNDKKIFKNILDIILKKDIGTVIIGIPFYKVECNEFSIKKFGEKLEKEIKNKIGHRVEIFYQNEIFSTKIAQNNLIKKGCKNIKDDDAESARIILESWLKK